MTAVPTWVLVEIACAVHRHGGDMDDVDDLVTIWIEKHGQAENELPAGDDRHHARQAQR